MDSCIVLDGVRFEIYRKNVMETLGLTFSMSDGAVLEDLAASAEDLLASSPDEMLLEGYTMSQEVFDNFLEAAAHPGTSHDPNFDYSAHPDPNQHQPF